MITYKQFEKLLIDRPYGLLYKTEADQGLYVSYVEHYNCKDEVKKLYDKLVIVIKEEMNNA